jgi:hypothetical protein
LETGKINMMVSPDRSPAALAAFSLAVLLLIMALGRYGKQAIEWLLFKLHEFFIQGNPLKI